MRSPVDSAQILSIMVANIVCASRPLYKIEQWASDYMDGLSEYNFNASIYNDDQLARKLDLLFKADRNSFIAELSANAIAVYLLEIMQIHNDSRHLSFVTLHFLPKNNKRLTPKLPEVKLLELIRKDFIAKRVNYFLNCVKDA